MRISIATATLSLASMNATPADERGEDDERKFRIRVARF
jgi:hypothetical protein